MPTRSVWILMVKTKWKYSRGNLIQRIWASFDGAVIMFAAYVAFIVLSSIFDWNYYEMPTILRWIFAPATLITGIPAGEGIWLGLPVSTIIVSLIIWVAVGYIIDFLHDPYN